MDIGKHALSNPVRLHPTESGRADMSKGPPESSKANARHAAKIACGLIQTNPCPSSGQGA